MYRDGTEHIVSDPIPVKLSFPGFPVIAQILELRSQGKVDEIKSLKLPWKLGKLCILHRLYVKEEFNYCIDCFLKPDCAFPRNPCWFIKKLPEKEALENIKEIIEKNPEIRKKASKCLE